MVGRSLLLTCDVSAEQEEPWRRLLQELSDAGRREEYVRSRRRLGIWAESVWFVPKPSGGGVTVAYLEASDPKRALRELAASEASFETYYSRVMGKRSGLDAVRLRQAATGELLFAWHDAAVWGEREAPNDSCPDAPPRKRREIR
jgi:hypothetical protein